VLTNYKAGMKLEGKVAVITGASMGIGEAIAKLLMQEVKPLSLAWTTATCMPYAKALISIWNCAGTVLRH